MTTDNLPAIAPRLDRLIKRRQDIGMPEPGPVDMGVLQTILLDEIAGRLDELGEAAMAIGGLIQKMEGQQEKIPIGKMKPYTKTITGDTIERWEIIDDVGWKCTSATVYNDGPDSCYICLGDLRDNFAEVKEGESLDFSFKHPVIERFFLKSSADGEASIRIILEY
jgi:hypothetical protein